MSRLSYRANLASKEVPFLSTQFGRTVVMKQYDQNFVRSIASKEDSDKDIGVAQAYYVHNVMASPGGYQSVGYSTQIAQYDVDETQFDQVLSIRKDTGDTAYLGVTLDGRLFVSYPPFSAWTYIQTIPNITGAKLTSAYINGETYIYVAKTGCYKFDFSTSTFVPVTLIGLEPTAILGITAADGYMLAWTSSTVGWSSIIDPLDFVPSEVTGAGGGSIQGALGPITTVFPNITGFIVYTIANVVTAVFSGNSNFPWDFRPIAGSGGLSNLDLLANSEDSAAHYIYGTHGIQQVSQLGSETVFSDLTDYVAGSVFEDFDEDTLEFSHTSLTDVMRKQLRFISNRFFVFSYGINELTHAYVYDKGQGRWGKLKITHTDCFEFSLLAPEAVETPKKSLAFLQKNGTVRIVDFSIKAESSFGVAIFGRYQFHRSRMLQLQTVDLDTVEDLDTFTLYDMVSLDGKTIYDVIAGYPLNVASETRQYTFTTVGLNHSLLCVGKFDLNAMVLGFNIHGRR